MPRAILRPRPAFLLFIAVLSLGFFWRLRSVSDPNVWREDEADIQRYYQMGQSLRFEGILRPPEASADPRFRVTAERMMLYPAFIAFFSSWGSSSSAGIRFGQLLVNLLCIGLICFLGWKVHSGACGLLAGLAFALHPALTPARLSMQQVYCLFVLLPVIFFMRWAEKPSLASAALAGVLLGLSLAFRSTLVFLLPVAVFFIWRRTGVRQSLLFLICALAVCAPWTIRNWHHFREWIPFEAQLIATNFNGATQGLLYPGSDIIPNASTANLYQMAFLRIFSNPHIYLISTGRRLILLIGKLISFCTLPAVLLALAAACAKGRDLKRACMVLMAAYFLLIHALARADERYLIPALPFVWILAASVLVSLKPAFRSILSLSFLGSLPAAALALAASLYLSELYWIGNEWRRIPSGIAVSAEDESRGYAEGYLYLERKEYEKAVSFFGKAAELNPGRAKPHNDRGVAYFLLNDKSRAEREFLESLRLDPQDVEAYNSLAALRLYEGRNQEALNHCEQALKILESRKPSEQRLRFRAEVLGNRATAWSRLGHPRFASNDRAENARIKGILTKLKRELPAYP